MGTVCSRSSGRVIWDDAPESALRPSPGTATPSPVEVVRSCSLPSDSTIDLVFTGDGVGLHPRPGGGHVPTPMLVTCCSSPLHGCIRRSLLECKSPLREIDELAGRGAEKVSALVRAPVS